MKIKSKNIITNRIYLFSAIFISLIGFFLSSHVYKSIKLITTSEHLFRAYAEDREEEDKEDEKDEEEEDDRKNTGGSSGGSQTQYKTETITVPATPVYRYVTVYDPGYDRDTDKDGLVDAIDPNPTIPEIDLFTDTDGDGIPNAHDLYPNEDDFNYIEFLDNNNNGIADEFEPKY